MSKNQTIITKYFKEFVSIKATNLKDMPVENFDFLCQALNFLRADEEVFSPELKSEIFDYIVAHSDEIVAKYESLPYARQTIDASTILDMLGKRNQSYDQNEVTETEAA